MVDRLGSTAARGTGLSGPLPALLPRAPVRSKACLRLVLELESADFCPTLWVSGRDVTDVLFHMSPILHALDDGDDPHEVPEQLVQLCMFY